MPPTDRLARDVDDFGARAGLIAAGLIAAGLIAVGMPGIALAGAGNASLTFAG